MTPEQMPDGRWRVIDAGSAVAGPFVTHAEAWRWIDDIAAGGGAKGGLTRFRRAMAQSKKEGRHFSKKHAAKRARYQKAGGRRA